MTRYLILLFGAVVATLLALLIYHQTSVSKLKTLPVRVFHWTDTSGTATVEQVRRVQSFSAVQKRRINLGYTEAIHWFRFRLPPGNQPDDYSVEIRNHTLDRVELFRVTREGVTSLGRTGSRFPFSQRPTPTRTFVYRLTTAAGQSAEYYLRLDKRFENLTTELLFWHAVDQDDKEQRDYFLWGIFSGIAGIVVLFALLLYRATRDPVYVWYGVYILGLSLRQFADTGLGFQFLWPRLPAINHPDALISALWLYAPATLQFQQHFLQLRTESSLVFRASQVLKYSFLCLFAGLIISQATGLVTAYTGSYRLITAIHSLLINIAMAVYLSITVIGLRSSDHVKRLYAIGFSIQLSLQMLIITQNMLRYQPDGVFFVDAYLMLTVNFFIDLLVFAYLLAYRYRKSVDEQRRLQISLAQSQQQTNEAIIDLLESERQQVGKLLLTDVGGRLAATHALLSALPPSLLQHEAIGLLQKTNSSLDQILRNSLPPDLNQHALPLALAELIRQRNQTGSVRLSFQYDDQPLPVPALSDTQTRQLYRIVNELINNIIRHAGATAGWVSLRSEPAGWQLTVSDNGHGYDPQRVQPGGIGLKNLHARARTLDATLFVDSGPTGTTVQLRLG